MKQLQKINNKKDASMSLFSFILKGLFIFLVAIAAGKVLSKLAEPAFEYSLRSKTQSK